MGLKRTEMSSADLAARAAAEEKAAIATGSDGSPKGITKATYLNAAKADRAEIAKRQRGTMSKIASIAATVLSGIGFAAGLAAIHLVTREDLNAFLNQEK